MRTRETAVRTPAETWRVEPLARVDLAAPAPPSPLNVLRFLGRKARQGLPTSLVTITGVIGTSSRGVGTIMGVARDGTFAGSMSSGCVEAAIVAEAIEAMDEGFPRLVGFGRGSRYIDIRLPCGGGLEVLFQIGINATVYDDATSRLTKRELIGLSQHVERPGVALATPSGKRDRWGGMEFFSAIFPPLRLAIFGHGSECLELTRQAQAYGAEVELWSPDQALLADASLLNAKVVRLNAISDGLAIQPDPWTAIVFLFHDHGWEPQLLARLLRQSWLIVGAMGSQRAHQARIVALRSLGVADEAVSRIVSPIGTMKSVRDASTLALATLGEVVDRYHAVIT